MVQVPLVANNYPKDAVASLTRAGLHERFTGVPAIRGADTGLNGYAVATQEPQAGTRVVSGSTVTLTLNLSGNGGGMPPFPAAHVTVPDVVGLDPNVAIGTLTPLGLIVEIPAADGRTTLEVARQSLTPGIQVTQGTRIRLDL
jgi:beta-lactam-binding protein with PASTA domain